MEIVRKHYRLILIFIPLVSLVLHFHVLNTDLIGYHVWRQTETQTVINNFYTGDFSIFNPRTNEYSDKGQQHRMEFPVMQWLFAAVYKLLGTDKIIVTRLLTFLMGIGTVFGMFYLTRNFFRDVGIAAIAAWCFNFSPVFYYYTINPMPDNMALCCGVWSIALFSGYLNSGKLAHVVLSSVFFCLAVLAKLPFIIYGVVIFSYLLVMLIRKERSVRQLTGVGLIYLAGVLIALSWYATVIPHWVIGAVHGVFDQSQNHPDLAYVIQRTIIAILPELIINYGSVLFFLIGFYFIFSLKLFRKVQVLPFTFLGLSLLAYFTYEMNIIDVVHDYYLFPFLMPVFLIVAYGAFKLLSGKLKMLKIVTVICLTILPLTAFLRADPPWDVNAPGFNLAYFKYKDELRKVTPANSYCVVGYDDSPFILLYYINRKGWAFGRLWFDEKLLAYHIAEGAQYIYMDEEVESFPGIKQHLGEKLFDKESIKVYKLK